jgi:hypothetical protein
MFFGLSDVSADSGRSPDGHPGAITRTTYSPSAGARPRVRFSERGKRKPKRPIWNGQRTSAKVSLVGTAERPERQAPLTGGQALESV